MIFQMKHKAQIAIEFLLLISMAFFIVIALLASVLSVSEQNTKLKSYKEMDDLGKSLQQEFLLASEMEDGYTRKLNLPMTAAGKSYSAVIGQTNNTYGYLLLNYQGAELFYMIPKVNGTLILGNNILTKNNDTLRIN